MTEMVITKGLDYNTFLIEPFLTFSMRAFSQTWLRQNSDHA